MAKRHSFGEIVGDVVANDAILSLADAVLMDEHVVSVVNDSGMVADDDSKVPVLALQLTGRLRNGDTFNGVFVMSLVDAGVLTTQFRKEVARSGDERAREDFRLGLALGAVGEASNG